MRYLQVFTIHVKSYANNHGKQNMWQLYEIGTDQYDEITKMMCDHCENGTYA